MARKRDGNIFTKRRSVLTRERVFAVGIVVALIVSGLFLYLSIHPGHYVISNARPLHRERGQAEPEAQRVGWDIVFDAEWEGRQALPSEAQTCTYRFVSEDGVVLHDGTFGLYVGEGETGVRLPQPVPDSVFSSAPPASADVIC